VTLRARWVTLRARRGDANPQGGTATKLILEIIFALAASQSLKLSVLGGPPVREVVVLKSSIFLFKPSF
jgi:hypothetical protein